MSTRTFDAEIKSIFQGLLGLDPPGADVDLVATGLLDSLTIVTLITELEASFEVRIPLEQIDLGSIRTIGRLQGLIEKAARQDGSASSVLQLLRQGIGRPVFLVHTSWAGAQTTAPLARVLATPRPIYAFQAEYYHSDVPPPTELEPLAAAYVRELRVVQPEGPYTLAGYSFGGLIAYAMAVALVRANEHVDVLGMVDVYADKAVLGPASRLAFRLRLLLHRVKGVLKDPADKIPTFLRKVRLRIVGKADEIPGRTDRSKETLRLIEIADVMEANYRPPLYPGDAVLLIAEKRSRWKSDPRKVWPGRVQGSLDTTVFPGGHTNLQPEAWDAIGAVLSPLLNEPV